MNALDAQIARTVRREFGRRSVDITRMDVQVVNQRVMLSGVLATVRDHPDTNLEAELEIIMKQLTRDRYIKEVTHSLRLLYPEKKQEDTGARGRARPGHTGR